MGFIVSMAVFMEGFYYILMCIFLDRSQVLVLCRFFVICHYAIALSGRVFRCNPCQLRLLLGSFTSS